MTAMTDETPHPRRSASGLLLELRGVSSRGDRSRPAVRDVDMSVHRGETVAVIGTAAPTVAALLVGDLPATAGTISRLGDAGVEHAARLPSGRVALPGRVAIASIVGSLARESDPILAERRFLSALEQVGLAANVDRGHLDVDTPTDVRLLALAEVIVDRPNVIVADEPFATLPSSQHDRLLDVLLDCRGHRTAVVVATRRRSVAERCQVIVDLDNRVVEVAEQPLPRTSEAQSDAS